MSSTDRKKEKAQGSRHTNNTKKMINKRKADLTLLLCFANSKIPEIHENKQIVNCEQGSSALRFYSYIRYNCRGERLKPKEIQNNTI